MSGHAPTRPLPNPNPPSRKTSLGPESSPEKENHAPKPRRPLPVPKDKDVLAPIPAAHFYGTGVASSSTKSQPGPGAAGSSHTTYAPPAGSPPAPGTAERPPFREPELIVEDEEPPPLVSADHDWSAADQQWGKIDTTPWEPNWQKDWEPGTKKVAIDGRNEEEESRWWDPSMRETHNRPGPGMLASLLLSSLHNPEHALFSITPRMPPPKPAGSSNSSNSSASSSPPPSITPEPFQAPSEEEIRKAVPHPNAYYCKEHNAWILVSWARSSVLPPIIPSYKFERQLPDEARRRKTKSCVSDDEHSVGQSNRTHHFHKYEAAVDARTLDVPFKRSEWEAEVHQKRRNRSVTLRIEDMDTETTTIGEKSTEAEGDLLDLYVCCQCSFYCLASREVIPGVIPLRRMEDFVKDKLENPPVGKTGPIALISGLETFITIVENRLFKGERRLLPVLRPKFQAKLGWNHTVQRVFDSMNFVLQDTDDVKAICPPSIDVNTPEGRRNRVKLLRAWIELSSWLAAYHRSRLRIERTDYRPQVLHVDIENAIEMIQPNVGAHINQMPQELPPALLYWDLLQKAWDGLGMTRATYSPSVLIFAYLAQCRCDPASTVSYFSYLCEIVETMKSRGAVVADDLELLIAEERSRGRFTHLDYQKAVSLLGFGEDNFLGFELEDDVQDDTIINAWKEAVKKAWRDAQDDAQTRVDLNEAFRIVAETRQSAELKKAWEQGKATLMTPNVAYSTLEVPFDMDETMLITIYNLRVEDQPAQSDKMREAMAVIAEVRDSSRLRAFLETGQDPGDPTSETRIDMPRGLNQLGNTCYLNSLLQYFYTIKDLRSAVSPLSGKVADLEKFSDDDLKRHRVGGRLVTRREIMRSKKFVNQLSDLFWNMEYCKDAAVTPSLDLAKLALVTSQDEEEDDLGSGSATDASNDTDATLVEDGPARPPLDRSSTSPPRDSPSPNSVLGKRGRNRGQSSSQPMEVDEPAEVDKDGYVIVSKPSSPVEPHRSPAKLRKSPRQEDIVMQDRAKKAEEKEKPPPLPPRKSRETDSSIMMFGRQHDVSECMDNCMFQIETALLDFNDEKMGSATTDKTSIIKRLFYGKKRQRLTALNEADAHRQRSHSSHEKEDLFSHLHLNVGDENFDLYDGLGRYFDDVVELEGVKKRMEVTIVDLPPLLQIQLQRVQFDRDTQQAYKSQAYVKFDETLFLDRYLDGADPEKRRRSRDIQSRLNACRDRVQRLTQGKHAPYEHKLGAVADFLTNQKVLDIPEADADLIARLSIEQSDVKLQLERDRSSAVKLKHELEDLWKNDSEAVYELSSVFIHQGSSPSFGHYFFYSRNLPNYPDQWFKYNDSRVSIVSKEEVFADTTGSTANPYMLVYARKGAEVIETVHRIDVENLPLAD